MELPPYIKPYPWYFKYLPISNHGFTTLAGKTIWLSQEIYDDLQRSNPKPLSISVLRHQEVHADGANFFKFFKFVTNKRFRLEEEEKSFKVMFRVLKENDETVDLEFVAKNFAGLRYIWMLSYDEALIVVKQFWNEV